MCSVTSVTWEMLVVGVGNLYRGTQQGRARKGDTEARQQRKDRDRVTRTRKNLERVRDYGGLTPSEAARTVLLESDKWVLTLIQEATSSQGTVSTRTEALCRLLGTYGVGTIVHGRIN